MRNILTHYAKKHFLQTVEKIARKRLDKIVNIFVVD